MRTITFDCPACGRRHVGETLIGRRTACAGRSVAFTEEWRPYLERMPPKLPGPTMFEHRLARGIVLAAKTAFIAAYVLALRGVILDYPVSASVRASDATVVRSLFVGVVTIGLSLRICVPFLAWLFWALGPPDPPADDLA